MIYANIQNDILQAVSSSTLATATCGVAAIDLKPQCNWFSLK